MESRKKTTGDNVVEATPAFASHNNTSRHSESLPINASNGPKNGADGAPLSSSEAVLSKFGIQGSHNLDPSQPNFNLEDWARTIARIREEIQLPRPLRSGFAFQNLTVLGTNPTTKHQDTVGTALLSPISSCARLFKRFKGRHGKASSKHEPILHNLHGVLPKGELLLVLGRPSLPTSTFLKVVAGETRSLSLSPDSVIHYSGVPHKLMTSEFRGELVYNGETDEHLPLLTVGQTLEFAATARTPRTRLPGLTRKQRIKHVVEVVMAVFGLSHARDTIVGDDYIRGVSGGERKRVSIAEMALTHPAISAWDNSTRGLDAATALGFVRSLRVLSDGTSALPSSLRFLCLSVCMAVTKIQHIPVFNPSVSESSNLAALYQSSEAMEAHFDKFLVLYGGRQIYFGPPSQAAQYFEEMGWHRSRRQTAADFITSVTDPTQRVPKPGLEGGEEDGRLPRTAEDFERLWLQSPSHSSLISSIEAYNSEHLPSGEQTTLQFQESRAQARMRFMRSSAPETIRFTHQVRLCFKRSWWRLQNSKLSALTSLLGQIIIALVVGSIFYGTPSTTDAFFAYGSVLFFSVLLNALMASTDIHALYGSRSVIGKQVSYALYRPSAEALGSLFLDIPVKFIVAVFFNVTLYFLAGLAYTAGQFFVFFLFVFLSILTLSMMFRTIAALTATLAQAMAISGVLILALVIYTGFVLPSPYMPPWFKWIMYINPLSYAYEALLVNQVHGTDYPCANIVPSYGPDTGDREAYACAVQGSKVGDTSVLGDDWVEASYKYSYSHLWRNLGILFGFFFFFLLTYLVAVDFMTKRSFGAGVMVFRKTRRCNKRHRVVEEAGNADGLGEKNSSSSGKGVQRGAVTTNDSPDRHRQTFTWSNISLDIPLKNNQHRRLLTDVSGWVKPGTMTALMGVSGAGKTTLLNVLAQRQAGGMIHGSLLVDGQPLPTSFQSSVGYVQQQDVHLETATVRETLEFSAILRQPRDVPKSKKLAVVQQTLKLLDMDHLANAVVGTAGGEGLNMEQRKRLSIGVELAAKPTLMLFLDEPTSGLDGQASKAIVSLLRKLADKAGLAILCTIHQPSIMIFQEYDRLLLLARGGKTTYFGDIGQDSGTLLRYFSSKGARECAHDENPAEYILDLIKPGGGGENTNATQDLAWPEVWNSSAKSAQSARELAHLTNNECLPDMYPSNPLQGGPVSQETKSTKSHVYPMPLPSQLPPVCLRIFQQYWRSPQYILSKLLLGVGTSLFIGFSIFPRDDSILGTQNAVFAVIMTFATFGNLVQQILSKSLLQQTLYSVRERHSNMYSPAVFLTANILAEIPYHLLLGLLTFCIFNYTVFGADRSPEEQALVLLLFASFYVFTGTFAQMLICLVPEATAAGRVTTILFSAMTLFAGVFQPPDALPGFWIFMWRVSPVTYLAAGVAVAGLRGNEIECAESERLTFQPPADGRDCGEYMSEYLLSPGGGGGGGGGGGLGVLQNPGASSDCTYCPLRSADQVLARSNMSYDDRWMYWGLGFAYIAFNIVAMFVFFYVFRMGRGMGNPAKKIRTWMKGVGRKG